MQRALIVIVMIFAVLLNGCAHQQHVAAQSPDPRDEQAEAVRKFSREDNWLERHQHSHPETWLEKHPVLNALVEDSFIILCCIGVGVGVGLVLWAYSQGQLND